MARSSPSSRPFWVNTVWPVERKRICHAICLADKASAVVLQVENELLHTLCLKFLHRDGELGIGRLIKAAGHCDIANAGTDQICFGDGRLGYRVADDLDTLALSGSVAFDDKLCRSAAGPTKKVSNFGIWLSKHRSAVDLNDLVAISQSRTVCRCGVECCTNISGYDLAVRVAEVADRCTNAIVAGTLVRPELLEFLCIEIVRMRIKGMQHSVDRRFKDFIVIELFADNMI